LGLTLDKRRSFWAEADVRIGSMEVISQRYDSLMYGQDELRNTTCIRFNPHDCEGMTLPFVDRVRVLLQSIRNEMNVDVIDDTPKLIVKYFFYGDVCSCV
jgi:hypothetical protein